MTSEEAFEMAQLFLDVITTADFISLSMDLGMNVIKDAYQKQPIEMDYIMEKIEDGDFGRDNEVMLLEWITELAVNDNYPGKSEVQHWINGVLMDPKARAA
jgi:hypothetical protein